VLTDVFARQHAMHAERDIVLSIPSVCPSNAGTVSKRMHNRHILTVW